MFFKAMVLLLFLHTFAVRQLGSGSLANGSKLISCKWEYLVSVMMELLL